MSLHISEKTRKKRKNQINKIKKETDFIIEKYEEKIYRIIKRKENIIKKQSQIYDVMITAFEEIISSVIKEVKKFYPNSFNEGSVVTLEDILYQEDGETLEERIKERLIDDPQKIQENLRRMSLIVETDGHRILYQTIKAKTKSDVTYIEIELGGGECSTGICLDYADEEIHPENDIDLPPYHPGCECEAIYYEFEDLIEAENS